MLTPEQLQELESERKSLIDFSDLTEKYSAQIGPDPSEEQTENIEEPENSLKNKLFSIPGAPTREAVEAWKTVWGEEGVSMAALADSDIFIFRYITDQEWASLQMVARSLTERAQGKTELLAQMEEDIKIKVLETCVLWPQVNKEFFLKRRAGLKEQLHYFIMLNSYFFSPQQAVAYTTIL